MAKFEINVSGKTADIITPYSAEFVKKVKLIGGAKWNGAKKCWTIPVDAVDTCRKFMREVYGECDEPYTGKRLKLRIHFLKDYEEYCAPVNLFGRTIASARSRDSGAVPGDGVVFEAGKPRSGGSAKNWTTSIDKGSIVVLTDVPESAYEKDKDLTIYGGRVFDVEVLDGRVDYAALRKERKLLAERIREIDMILALVGKEEGYDFH